MASNSYRQWRLVRCRALDEMATAHAAVGGSARGRRFATQQINRAYAVLLASQFQGFCRDLHSECVDHLLTVINPPSALRQLIQSEMVRGRQLDRGNAQPSSLGADFHRLDVDLWGELAAFDVKSARWKNDLDLLNEWRNAIVHQDFTSTKVPGIIYLPLAQVRRWRYACSRLARAMDNVLQAQMLRLTGVPPW